MARIKPVAAESGKRERDLCAMQPPSFFRLTSNGLCFCFQEERLKVKGENPSYSICEIAKELGRRWAEMAPEIKQRYQQVRPTGLSHL